MNNTQIGICSWSIDRHDVLRAIAIAGHDLQMPVIQIGFFTAWTLRDADATAIRRAADTANVEIVANFIAFEGEDYSSIATIAQTGGFMPDELYQERLALTEEAAAMTSTLACDRLATHIGTVPQDESSADYAKLVRRVQEAADRVAAHGVRLLIETGRESAASLSAFMETVDRTNVGINFDPANFVMFGTDDPARSVAKLLPAVEAVHMKDATMSKEPGEAYGRYAALGVGDASIARVVNKLRLAGYGGPLLIERGGGTGEIDELRAAADFLRSLIA